MFEYKCPKCQSNAVTSKGKIAGSERILMIICSDCGHFLGVVNDLSSIKDALRHIAAKTGGSINI